MTYVRHIKALINFYENKVKIAEEGLEVVLSADLKNIYATEVTLYRRFIKDLYGLL